LSAYIIITFFAVFTMLHVMKPSFVTRREKTKPYEAPRTDYGVVFLISVFAAASVGVLIWKYDSRSEVKIGS
jgi:hypothetical protein